MSYHTWSTDGYGFCASDIQTTVPKIQSLLLCAPEFATKLAKDFKADNIINPTLDDYLDYEDIDCCKGIAYILREVISEAENIDIDAADDFDGNWYVLLLPSYPWAKISLEEKTLTKEKIKEIFVKYIKVLTDEDVYIDFCCVENGG